MGEPKPLISFSGSFVDSTGNADLVLEEIYKEVETVLSALTGPRFIESFRREDDGAKGKSLAPTLRRLLRNEFLLRGWRLDWLFFPGDLGFQGSAYSVDAFIERGQGANRRRVGVEFGWDVVSAAPANLVKADLLRSAVMSTGNLEPLDLLVVLAPTSAFKKRAELDSNAATTDLYRQLSKPYSGIVQTRIRIAAIEDLGGYVLEVIPGVKKTSKIREV